MCSYVAVEGSAAAGAVIGRGSYRRQVQGPDWDDAMRRIEHWIAGRTVAGTSARVGPVWNPATGEQQAEGVLGSAADVDDAVRHATDAFAGWAQTSLAARTKVLFAM